jgi:hypothetical protein
VKRCSATAEHPTSATRLLARQARDRHASHSLPGPVAIKAGRERPLLIAKLGHVVLADTLLAIRSKAVASGGLELARAAEN